jgi:hypothetical protein
MPALVRLYIVAPVPYPDVFKVGVTADTARRLAQLQTGNPSILEVYYESPPLEREDAFGTERIIKQAFKESALGGEWFYEEPHHGVKFAKQLLGLWPDADDIGDVV